MKKEESLTNHFLIAMPGLKDPNFFHTVTYICQHNDEGALGVIINRPAKMALSEIFEQMEIAPKLGSIGEYPVCFGGPVQMERGFILHRAGSEWKSTLPVTETVSLTTSRDLLEAMAAGEGPETPLITLGYAGWAAGQLEQEILDNSWLSVPADEAILFDLPFQERWKAAAGGLGIDLDLLSSEAGHA